MKKTTFALLSMLCSSSVFAELKVDDGYMRAVPPGQMMSAAFMQLTNTGDKVVELTGGVSGDVKSIEVHNHKKEDNVMKMYRVPSLTIEPGQSVTLKPGGLHIMFIGLKKMVKAGDNFAFDLSFKDGTTQSLELPIKSIVN
jgi:copper(I)-binding protein